MNLIRWFSGHLSESRRAKPNPRRKILNLTRQAVLADCVEVADHGASRRKGLLGRNGLPAGEGLWIVPCESVHTFGMKFPIDLVYVDKKRRGRKGRDAVPAWGVAHFLR